MTDPILSLVRPDLRDFGGYSSARKTGLSGSIWLNANESPWQNPADATAGCQRYPAPQPPSLQQSLARLYQVEPNRILMGRGSDEVIDLLVRALCRPEQDAVVISSPVFGMYAVSARLQNAPLVDCPLVEDADGFAVDFPALEAAVLQSGARLVFVCAPGNPTGHAVALSDIATLAERVLGQALVVVDEAYAEFSDQPSALELLSAHRNVAVLRTLSKAHALAGARVGCLVGDPALVAILRHCQAPYPLPSPCVELAVAALQPEVLTQTQERIALLKRERERLAMALRKLAGVRRVYDSQGNFLLVRFEDAEAAFRSLLARGVVVRDQRAVPALTDALRISVGSPEENDAVLTALEALA